MKFPLPSGCRKVCRPVRNPPRLSRLEVCVRMAIAAMKNGEDPCAISSTIAVAVGCQPCQAESEALSISVGQLEDSVGMLFDALVALADLFGLKRGSGIPDDPSWWEIIFEFFKTISKIVMVVEAIAGVLEAGWRVIDNIYSVIENARAVRDCLSRQVS